MISIVEWETSGTSTSEEMEKCPRVSPVIFHTPILHWEYISCHERFECDIRYRIIHRAFQYYFNIQSERTLIYEMC